MVRQNTAVSVSTADFAYEVARDPAGLPACIAVFADRESMRAQIVEDLVGAGFRESGGGPVADLLGAHINVLGDVVLVDCPVADAQTLAALNRLDMRIARAGSQLIVSTSIDALDDVFAALDQSDPQLLVNPTRADRLVAVGRVMSRVSNSRVREMTEEDRLTLLRLAQQVDAIASKIDGLTDPRPAAVAEPSEFVPAAETMPVGDDQPVAETQPYAIRRPLPDPRLVRKIIANRRARARFFDEELFADPAWDMLLDLTVAHAEHRRVSVTSLCIASGVPPTTALRWVRQLVDCGVFERIADSTDKRRAFIALSDKSVEAMASYFQTIEVPEALAA